MDLVILINQLHSCTWWPGTNLDTIQFYPCLSVSLLFLLLPSYVPSFSSSSTLLLFTFPLSHLPASLLPHPPSHLPFTPSFISMPPTFPPLPISLLASYSLVHLPTNCTCYSFTNFPAFHFLLSLTSSSHSPFLSPANHESLTSCSFSFCPMLLSDSPNSLMCAATSMGDVPVTLYVLGGEVASPADPDPLLDLKREKLNN